MTDRTNAKRQAEARARERASGLMRKTMTLPVSREAELEEILARWMKEKEEADAQALADPST